MRSLENLDPMQVSTKRKEMDDLKKTLYNTV